MTLETANRLYELRKKHNLSQEELAEKLGVSRQAVSKWERSEASPDTDNLIALAKLYGLSIDELIYGEKEESEEESKETEETAEESFNKDDVKIAIEEDDGDKVTITNDGILVEEKDGTKVKIRLKGKLISKIFNKIENEMDDFECVCEEDEDCEKKVYVSNDGKTVIKINKAKKNTKFWLEVPYAIICVIAYLLFGFYDVLGGWGQAWVIFVTIPVYYSFVEAIYKRRFSEFAYAVLAAFLFLLWGMYGIIDWHPGWIIFLTIPVYDWIASALDKWISSRK